MHDKKIILGTLAAFVSVVLLVWRDRAEENSPRESTQTSDSGQKYLAKEINQPTNTATATSKDKTADHSNQQVASSMPSILEGATDYRVVFEQLLRDNSGKSGLYAMHILKICSNQRAVELVTTSISTQQDRARDLLVSRCATFSSDELSEASRRRLISDTRAGGGLRDLLTELQRAGTEKKARTESLTRVLAARDPLLLEYVGASLLYRYSTDNFHYDGKSYGNEQGQLLINIWNAAACEATDTTCGSADPVVTEVCATTGKCFESRAELARIQSTEYFGQDGRMIFDDVYKKMVATIKNGDVRTLIE